MDNQLSSTAPYLTILRTYARLLCQDSSNGDRLLEETLSRAISLVDCDVAQAGTLLWLLRLMHDAVDTAAPVGQGTPADEVDPLFQVLRGLPLNAREAVVLTDVLGRPGREAATILGCTETELRNIRENARAALKRLLAERALN